MRARDRARSIFDSGIAVVEGVTGYVLLMFMKSLFQTGLDKIPSYDAKGREMSSGIC